MDQMALLKTTQPLAPVRMPVAQDTQATAPWEEMIQVEEMITVYPEHHPSSIHSLQDYRPPLLKHTTPDVLRNTSNLLREREHNRESCVDESELHTKGREV